MPRDTRAPDLPADPPAALTAPQRRSVRRRVVGRLWEGGGYACRVRPGDTEAMARAIFDREDPDLMLAGKEVVDWCRHPAHWDEQFCDAPIPIVVWAARFPVEEVPDAAR